MLFPLLSLALAAPCPTPTGSLQAAISPDGGAHIITSGATTACWWFVDDNGEPEVVRHFALDAGRPVALRWDEALQAVCIDLIDTNGRPRTRIFPAPSETTAWGSSRQDVR